MKYNKVSKCSECGKFRMCTYEPTGPFKGLWVCLYCAYRQSDALADMVKALEKMASAEDENNG